MRPPAVPPPLADGTAVAHTLPMSATRYRDGCLSVFLLAGLLALAPRSDAAWADVAGSHAGGHVGGFRGGGPPGLDVSRGGNFGGGFLGRRPGAQRFSPRPHPPRSSFPALCTAIVSVARMEASGRTAISLSYDRMRPSCPHAMPLTASSNSGASHGRRIMPDASAVAVHRLRREGRHAHRDVLRTLRLGRAVLHPLAAPRDDGLSRAHVDRPAGVVHTQQALQHDRVLVELGRLPRLDPAGGAPHVRDAHRLRLRAHAADV